MLKFDGMDGGNGLKEEIGNFKGLGNVDVTISISPAPKFNILSVKQEKGSNNISKNVLK